MRAYLDEPITEDGKTLVDPITLYGDAMTKAEKPRSKMSVEDYMNKETRRLADKAKQTGMVDRINDGD